MTDRSRYPAGPGVRANATGGTSEAAAAFIAPHVAGLCVQVLKRLEAGPASPEELAAAMARDGEPALLTTLRARCTQLKRLGLACDSGLRGLGESGKVKVVKWRLTDAEERRAFATAQAAAKAGEVQS